MLAIAGTAWWAVATVIGWKDDAAKLPGIIKERDDAKAAKAELEDRVTKKFDAVTERLSAIEKASKGVTVAIAANQIAVDAAVRNFTRKTANATNLSPGSADTGVVLDGLLDLFGAAGAATGGAPAGGSAAGRPAQPPATPAGSPALPGRKSGAEDGQAGRHGALRLPDAAGGARGDRGGAGRRADRRGDRRDHRRLAGRSGPPVPAPALAGPVPAAGAAAGETEVSVGGRG
ncbi:MAG: hypothetical protein WDN08_05415 [Rhizomicrobium sp.]